MKNTVRLLVVDIICLVMFSVIAFTVPFKKTGAFWLAYVFGALSIAVQLFVMYSAFNMGKDVKSKYYGFPVAKVGVFYVALQIVVSLVLMALSAVCPVWVAVLVCVLLLCVSAIGFITVDAVRDEVVKQDNTQHVEVKTIKSIELAAKALVSLSDDADIKKSVTKLADALKYSDPVSSPATQDLEEQIKTGISQLKELVKSGDIQEVSSIVKKLCELVNERNEYIKESK